MNNSNSYDGPVGGYDGNNVSYGAQQVSGQVPEVKKKKNSSANLREYSLGLRNERLQYLNNFSGS